MTAPPIPAQSIQVFCPDCEQMVAVVARRASIWTALSNHTCTTAAQPRGNTMSAQPLHSVPATGKRPHPRELVKHDDKKIARAAQKVLDAVAALDAAWEANAAKAGLRAERDRLKKQLADVEAQLRGTAPQAVDAKAVRAWAAANGVDCPSSGIVPKRVVDAWRAAQ